MSCVPTDRLPELPADLVATLADASLAWVGETLAAALAGRWQPPDGFTLATGLPARELQERLPSAVVTAPGGRRLTLPTAAGPADLLPGISADPAVRTAAFAPLALAWDPRSRRLTDPCAGSAGLQTGRLDAVGDPRDRLAARPELGPRALRLCARLGLEPSEALDAALARCPIDGVSSLALGRELRPLLAAEAPGPLLRRLARYGWVGPRPDALPSDLDALLAALPGDARELRLAAWLRGGRVGTTLRRLHVGVERAQRVRRLLDHHPIERHVPPHNAARVAQLRRRLGAPALTALLELRAAEVAAGDTAGAEPLRVLRATLAAVERRDARDRVQEQLAVDGRTLMQWLDLRPGPAVGEALRRLAEHVLVHPEDNTPERLHSVLSSWGDPADR